MTGKIRKNLRDNVTSERTHTSNTFSLETLGLQQKYINNLQNKHNVYSIVLKVGIKSKTESKDTKFLLFLFDEDSRVSFPNRECEVFLSALPLDVSDASVSLDYSNLY